MAIYNLLNLCKEQLDTAIVKTFFDEATVLNLVPVISASGKAYAYNRCNSMFDTENRELGADISTIQELTTEKIVKEFAIKSERVRVDRALILMSDTDVRAEQSEIMARSMARGLNRDIITEVKAVATGVNGINATISGAVPSVDEICGVMDNMKYKEADTVIFMNSKTAREVSKQAIKDGFLLGHKEMFGKSVQLINGCPVIIARELADNEVVVAYCNTAEGLALATVGGVRAIDLGQVSTQLVTDMEIIYVPVIKDIKAVGYLSKAVAKRK